MSLEQRDDCEAFAATVNAVLDGDAPALALTTGHPLGCADCRSLAAAARLLASADPVLRIPPAASPELRTRLVRATTSTQRRHWMPAITVGVALVIGVWLTWPKQEEPVVAGRTSSDTETTTTNAARPQPVPRLADQWATVASIARSATERAGAPVRHLPTATVSLSPVPPPSTPDFAALAPFEQATKVTTEPVAGATRRAVDLFLRDLGLSTPIKPAG